MAGRFSEWFSQLATKSSMIDGTETTPIFNSGGTWQKASLLDIVRYVLANGFAATDLNIAGRQYIRAVTKTLTKSSTIGVIDIALTAGKTAGGRVLYTIEASDGTDYQSLTGYVAYTVVNKAGTLTSNLSAGIETPPACSAGTLSCTPSLVAGTNKITFSLNAVPSFASPTILRVRWQLAHCGNATITPL